MCGISGYVGPRDGTEVVLEGLRHLEYRGYDSAGLALAGPHGLKIHKVVGRVAELAETLPDLGCGRSVIGHTRWATHGEPSVANAHPHVDAAGQFAVVHNGIIENASRLREQLRSAGYRFISSTDTEVLAHLLASVATDADLERTVRVALASIEGTYAIAVLSARTPEQIVVARQGSPIVLGIGEGEHFVASDVAAFARYTSEVFHLEDREVAVVEADRYAVAHLDFGSSRCRVTTRAAAPGAFEIGTFSHFMAKEIHEQPAAVERFVSPRIASPDAMPRLDELELDRLNLAALRRVRLLGCGSAFYTGILGARLIERLSRIPAGAEPASEFRYRHPVIEPDTLYVLLSQSGETFDTLEAAWEIQRRGGTVVAIVNAADSSLARACPRHLSIDAGPEISVTSTKSFTSTAAALLLLAVSLGRRRELERREAARVLRALERLPTALEIGLEGEARIAEMAARYAHVQSSFFIGRALGYAVALEGSQKLKEVSYIHAEAYPCGELKHGPLALVTPELPTIAVIPNDELFAKNLATLHEVGARKGPIIAVGHSAELKEVADDVVIVSQLEPEVDPMLSLLPLQLFAYHVAVQLGVDVDKPRNLAKSVTVE